MTKARLSDLWTPAESIEYPTRWSIGLWGPPGGGKSHFLVNTCPGPVFIANFDRDISALVVKSGRDDIYVANLHTAGLVLTDKRAEELIEHFQTALEEVTAMTEGTFALDGGSALHHALEQLELARFNASQRKAKREQHSRLPSLQRGGINAQINAMLASVSNSPVNFVITHQQREIWDQAGKPTGEFEPRENSQIMYGVDMEARMFAQWTSAGRDKQGKAIPKRLEHYARITLCKHKRELEDTSPIKFPTWEFLTGLMELD